MWLAAGVLSAAAGAGLLLRSQYEREQLSVERTEILTEKITRDCRMVFLSDLHDHEFGDHNKRLLHAVDEVKPDVILIGGDMMVSRESADLRVSLELIGELTKRCPVYYGNGNHETRMNRERKNFGMQYDIYVRKLKKMGVHSFPTGQWSSGMISPSPESIWQNGIIRSSIPTICGRRRLEGWRDRLNGSGFRSCSAIRPSFSIPAGNGARI